MLTLPKKIIHVLRHFEVVLSEHVWEWAKVLLIGALLAKGRTNHCRHLESDGMLGRASNFRIPIECSTARSGRVVS
jgi:hypothetical protein